MGIFSRKDPEAPAVVVGTLEVVSISNGYALYGKNRAGQDVFLAHLGDGVDGLPAATDSDLPEAYGFVLLPR